MITNQRSDRNGGRPRVFENEDAFAATARVLFRIGYSLLTIDSVAREVGCSAPALSKRFGSKSALIKAYLIWMDAQMRERFVAVRREHDSPLEALLARYTIPMQDRLEEFGPLTGANEMQRDPELGPLLESAWTAWGVEIKSLLHEAVAAGELRDIDTDDLADVLGAALGGASARWTPGKGDLLKQYVRLVEIVLRPYVTDQAPAVLRRE